MNDSYDRGAEDVGNIVALEHVNLCMPDQRVATLFYISGLGFTRDPYLFTGLNVMWVNVGCNQFHLPTGAPQQLRGRVGLVVPDLDALAGRLEAVHGELADTAFEFAAEGDRVEARCPWGNHIVCHAPDPRFGPVALGMAYVELDVAPGTAPGIARFYAEALKAPVSAEEGVAVVAVGARQSLVFRETGAALPDYDGHHIQIYVADFSGPHAWLKERGLVSEESDQHQYRFVDIVDPETGTVLTNLEHEVRSMTHPLYARPLVNRDPARSNTSFAVGREARAWTLPPD